MVKVLNIAFSYRNCFAYFFVRTSVHVYSDILSPVFLELGRLMLSVSQAKEIILVMLVANRSAGHKLH